MAKSALADIGKQFACLFVLNFKLVLGLLSIKLLFILVKYTHLTTLGRFTFSKVVQIIFDMGLLVAPKGQ